MYRNIIIKVIGKYLHHLHYLHQEQIRAQNKCKSSGDERSIKFCYLHLITNTSTIPASIIMRWSTLSLVRYIIIILPLKEAQICSLFDQISKSGDGGNLGIIFGYSSYSIYPSILVSTRTSNDDADELNSIKEPQFLKLGTANELSNRYDDYFEHHLTH